MQNVNLIEILGRLGVQFVPFLFALCFHEFAHGYVAKKRGDNTAELMGRLTMNPFAHADMIGTFILPIVGILTGGFVFGWAKPVPVNGRNLKDAKRDMFWIALAGPLSNMLLATISVFVYVIAGVAMQGSFSKSVQEMALGFVVINVLLGVFNMIPLHPLDGGKVLARFIPDRWNDVLEENQATLQTILIFTFVGLFVVNRSSLLEGPMNFIISALIWLAATVVGFFV